MYPKTLSLTNHVGIKKFQVLCYNERLNTLRAVYSCIDFGQQHICFYETELLKFLQKLISSYHI